VRKISCTSYFTPHVREAQHEMVVSVFLVSVSIKDYIQNWQQRLVTRVENNKPIQQRKGYPT